MDKHEYEIKKKDFLLRYLKLTREIGTKIDMDDLDSINNILLKREQLIEEIKKIDSIIDTSNNDEIKELLLKIREFDDENNNVLESDFVSLKKKIASVKGAKRVNKAYNTQQNYNSFFLNKVR